MPFIEVKMWEGRTAKEKKDLIEKITSATCESINCPEGAVQIVLQEYPKSDWGISGKPSDI